jgi:hypothetical protein
LRCEEEPSFGSLELVLLLWTGRSCISYLSLAHTSPLGARGAPAAFSAFKARTELEPYGHLDASRSAAARVRGPRSFVGGGAHGLTPARRFATRAQAQTTAGRGRRGVPQQRAVARVAAVVHHRPLRRHLPHVQHRAQPPPPPTVRSQHTRLSSQSEGQGLALGRAQGWP